MFKLVIVDLIGILSSNENEYAMLKKVTNFKGTIQSLEGYIGEYYDKLLTGKITESVFWRKVIEKTGTRKKLENIKNQFFKSFDPIFDANLLKKARENFKFALCSNFYKPWYEAIKKKYKIIFDYESLSSEAKLKKNNKLMYLNAMLNFNLKADECIVISDESSDLSLAKEMGMNTLHIPGKTKEYKEADYSYHSFNDFLKILI